MGKNREAKQKLIEKYGAECFIERLKLRDTSGIKYKSKGQYKLMKQLTYHHIIPKSKGGQATEENGAILSNENHIWFNEQSNGDQARMNKMFQQLKKDIDEVRVVFSDDIDTEIEVKAAEIIIDKKGQIFKKTREEKERWK